MIPATPASHRIRFANQLRGVAALSVALSHLVGVYWAMQDVVSAATFSPPQGGAIPGIFALVSHPWFNFGPFGVAVFFLISGLVIPFSFDTHSRISFVAARLLRIFPTYAAALLIEMLVLYIAARAWGRPFAYSGQMILSNVFLYYDLVGQPSIDLVNWTLSVELKFYLMMALLAGFVRRGSLPALLLAGAGLAALNVAFAGGLLGPADALPSTPAYTASSHAVCLGYMLLGTAFNFHLRGKIGTLQLLGALAALLGLFTAGWRMSVWQGQWPIVTANYYDALLLFGGLYAVRRWVPRNPVLDALAAISFPFYVLHSLMGYTLLRAFTLGLGLGYYPALVLAVGTVGLAAAGLHRVVEIPTARLGRRLAPAARAQRVKSREAARVTSA